MRCVSAANLNGVMGTSIIDDIRHVHLSKSVVIDARRRYFSATRKF